MTAPTVAHLVTAVAVIGGGMLVGHVIAPYSAGAGAVRRVLFAAAMLALGAWRGRAEWRTRAEWYDRPLRRRDAHRAAALGAVGALLLAAAGYGVAHG